MKRDRVITSFRFVENMIGQFIYPKVCVNKFSCSSSHDILLASIDIAVLKEIKCLLLEDFEMNDLREIFCSSYRCPS